MGKLSSHADNSQKCYRVNRDFVAPKQIWRQVSAASNASDVELKNDEPFESSSSNSSQNSCPANGDLGTSKQKWRPVSTGTVSLNDIASSYCEANRNADVTGEIQFKMQGDPSFIATNASNGEALESSCASSSQNHYRVNVDFVSPKQIWRQVSAASNTSNGELKKNEPLESSSWDDSQNSCSANGDLRTIKQKGRPVSGGTVSLNDIASDYCEVNRNVDVTGEILFKMQGEPSFIATNASIGETKNREAMKSSGANNSQNYYRVNTDFVAPKQIWRQVSAASNTSNVELKKDEPFELSSSNSSQNSCPANGDLGTLKQKWRPVSGGTVSLKDTISAYCEVNWNVDVAGEILFNMQGNPSFIATSSSNGEVKNGETSRSSRSNDSQNYYRVNGDLAAPMQIWRQVSAANSTSNGELKKDEPLESSSSNSSQNSCPSNGDLRTIKQKWRPVSRGTVSLNDITSSYCEVNLNVDVAGKIPFNMQGDPSFIATSASNGEFFRETSESSCSNDSQNYYRVNGDFLAPKQILGQVSAASNTSNGELKKDEPLEPSNSYSLHDSCPTNGDLRTIKQKWRPVSTGTVSLNDISSSYYEANRNADVAGEIQFKRQGDPSFVATNASNGEVKNGETFESSGTNNFQNFYRVNEDFVAPKQIWRQVSAASNTSNGELKKDEPLDSSSGNSSQNSCPSNGDLRTIKQKWKPVSGGTVSLNDTASSYSEANPNVDVGEIQFKMQGDPSFIATNASNGEAKYEEALESSCANNFLSYYRVNGDFVVPKQIWRQVSAVSNTSNSELKKDEPFQPPSSNSSQNSCPEDGDLRTLKQKWRPVSGGTVSLKDIASDYCEANKNVDVSGEVLFRQGDPSFIATSASNGAAKNGETLESSCANNSQTYSRVNGDFVAPKQMWQQVSTASNTSNRELKKDEPLESSSSNSSQNPCPANGDLRTLKQNWGPVSGGTGSNQRTKPLKVESKEDLLHKDMENFLFKMLGVGFQLGRNVINEVLDNCGYDMQKSMETLLDRSAAGLDERSKFLVESNKKTNNRHPRAEEPSSEKNKVFECQWRSKTTKGQKREPKGKLVEGPRVDSVVIAKVDTVGSQEDKKDDEDEENNFQALRRAVEEYRGTMKEYYKAAFEAFAKGDQDLANRLVEQGQFYREKARRADEESNQKIFDTRNTNTEYEMSLDLHDHGAKEAIRLLKCHLSSLAGISSFKYLKVIVDKNEEGASKCNRRRSVMRLLDKESITWNEGETLGIIRIQMDNINPKNLSFAKKYPSL